MKNIFLKVSMLIVTTFLVWAIVNNQNQIKFASYESVNIQGMDPAADAVNREDFTKEINQLASQTGSVVARRIVEPSGLRQTVFTYDVYGEGQLPEGLKEASEESAQISDLANSYLLISGPLDSTTLLNKFSDLGYNSFIFKSESLPIALLSITTAPTNVLSLIIILLTFAALTMISRIKELRAAGMRIISGESFLSVMFRSFLNDFQVMIILFIIAVITGMMGLAYFRQAHSQLITLLVLGLFLFSCAIIFISFSLSTIYLFGLKKSGLTDIIKGKLPLNQLLSIMLIGQLTGVIIVGVTANQLLENVDVYQKQISAEAVWSQNTNLYNLSFGQSLNGGSVQEMVHREGIWYDFASEAVAMHDAMLVVNNLDRFNMSDTSDGVYKDDYSPIANTIYVTPNYLINQGIQLEESVLDQLMTMEEGQFGLLLPNKLKENTTDYVTTYTESMQSYGRSGLEIDSDILFEMTAITAYIDDNQDRFLFNVDRPIQTLKDPIIVVVTPQSMGNTPASRVFWMANMGGRISFKGYEETIDLLKENEVYSWVSYVTNGRLNYLSNMNDRRMELIQLIAGSLMGVVTAILLFSTMTLLYFEKFRRDIFIKRMAGMSFIENHQMYLLAQLASLGVASLVIVLLTRNITVTLATLSIFLIIAMIIMYKQMNHENKLAVTVMKGK